MLYRKKIPTEEPLFRLVAVDLVKTDAPIYHISRYLPVVRQSTAPFSFVLSFTLPHGGRILGLVLIFEADEAYGGVGQNKGGSSDEDSEEDEGQLAPYDLCLARYVNLECFLLSVPEKYNQLVRRDRCKLAINRSNSFGTAGSICSILVSRAVTLLYVCIVWHSCTLGCR